MSTKQAAMRSSEVPCFHATVGNSTYGLNWGPVRGMKATHAIVGSLCTHGPIVRTSRRTSQNTATLRSQSCLKPMNERSPEKRFLLSQEERSGRLKSMTHSIPTTKPSRDFSLAIQAPKGFVEWTHDAGRLGRHSSISSASLRPILS